MINYKLIPEIGCDQCRAITSRFLVHSMLVGQYPTKSLWTNCPSIYRSVCPAGHLSICVSVTEFPKIGSLVFFNSVHEHDDSWLKCLVTGKARFLKKKKSPKFWLNGPKLGQKLDFLPFCQAWFISFLWNCI